MKKSLITLLVLVILVTAYYSLTKPVKLSDQEPIKIGAAFAMTGDAAPWGEASLNAANLAVEKINAGGGIHGNNVKLVVEDSKSTSKDTVTAVSKLQNVDRVNAIAATWLDSFQGAGNVINDKMLLISPDAAIESVNIPTNYPRVLSVWYRTEAKSKVTLERMQSKGVKNVYILLQNDPYYVTLMGFLEKEAAAKGINIVGKELINPNNNDLRTVLSKINATNADAIFFGSYDSKLSTEFLKEAPSLLNKKITRYGDEFIEQYFRSGDYPKSLFEGIEYYAPSTPPDQFVQEYKGRFNKEPVFSAGTTYNTIMVIAKYLADEPADIDAYMHKTAFNTVTYGKITFDSLGGVVSENPAIVMRKIENGKIIDIK